MVSISFCRDCLALSTANPELLLQVRNVYMQYALYNPVSGVLRNKLWKQNKFLIWQF